MESRLDSADATRADLSAQDPWPGLYAFTEGQAEFFFGRDAMAEELLRMVRRHPLTVLFGQSGMGKTSLLHAGLFPRLRQLDFVPVYVKLDFTEGSASLTEQVRSALREVMADGELDGPAFASSDSLWEYFHRRDAAFWTRRNRPAVPVLVFDQFEELFTVGREHASAELGVDEFLEDFADLIENRTPARLRDAEEGDPAEEFHFGECDCRAIVALREDFLAQLEELRTQIRSIAQNRIRLGRLSQSEALDAVLRPAANLVDPDTGARIVEFVAGASEHEGSASGLEVDPSLLSIVCQRLNARRKATGSDRISADLLAGSQTEILAEYYEECIANIPETARIFIEDRLLTRSGFRDSVALENALGDDAIPPDVLARLVNRRLLHVDQRMGVLRLELTHDILTAPVFASRTERHQREELAAVARREVETRVALSRARRQLAIVGAFALALVALVIYTVLSGQAARRAEMRSLALAEMMESGDRSMLTSTEGIAVLQLNRRLEGISPDSLAQVFEALAQAKERTREPRLAFRARLLLALIRPARDRDWIERHRDSVAVFFFRAMDDCGQASKQQVCDRFADAQGFVIGGARRLVAAKSPEALAAVARWESHEDALRAAVAGRAESPGIGQGISIEVLSRDQIAATLGRGGGGLHEGFAYCLELPIAEAALLDTALAKIGYHVRLFRPSRLGSGATAVCALWEQRNEASLVHYGLSLEQLRQRDRDLREAGFIPVDVTCYGGGGWPGTPTAPQFAAVWRQAGPVVPRQVLVAGMNVDAEGFRDRQAEMRKKGFSIVTAQVTVSDDGTQWIHCIFSTDPRYAGSEVAWEQQVGSVTKPTSAGYQVVPLDVRPMPMTHVKPDEHWRRVLEDTERKLELDRTGRGDTSASLHGATIERKATALLHLGRNADVVKFLTSVADTSRGGATADVYYWRGLANFRSGNLSAGNADAQVYAKHRSHSTGALSYLRGIAQVYRREPSLTVADSLATRKEDRYNAACIYAWAAGLPERQAQRAQFVRRALELLGPVLGAGDVSAPDAVQDSDLKSLRAEPAFWTLINARLVNLVTNVYLQVPARIAMPNWYAVDSGSLAQLLENASSRRIPAGHALFSLDRRPAGDRSDLSVAVWTTAGRSSRQMTRLTAWPDLELGWEPIARGDLPAALSSSVRRLFARLRSEDLQFENASLSARRWWDAFERENVAKPGTVQRLMDELVRRKATIQDFFLSYVYSNTDNIQANLDYMDARSRMRLAGRTPAPNPVSKAYPHFLAGGSAVPPRAVGPTSAGARLWWDELGARGREPQRKAMGDWLRGSGLTIDDAYDAAWRSGVLEDGITIAFYRCFLGRPARDASTARDPVTSVIERDFLDSLRHASGAELSPVRGRLGLHSWHDAFDVLARGVESRFRLDGRPVADTLHIVRCVRCEAWYTVAAGHRCPGRLVEAAGSTEFAARCDSIDAELSRFRGEIDARRVHAIVFELVRPVLERAIRLHQWADLDGASLPMSKAAKYLVHEKEIAFTMAFQLPDPRTLDAEGLRAFGRTVNALEGKYGGVESRVARMWVLDVKTAEP